MKSVMPIPKMSSNINTNIGTITPTSTTVTTPVLPSFDTTLELILGTPFIRDGVYIISFEAEVDLPENVIEYDSVVQWSNVTQL